MNNEQEKDLKEKLSIYITNDKLITGKVYKAKLSDLLVEQNKKDENRFYLKFLGTFTNAHKKEQKIYTSYSFDISNSKSYFYAIAKLVKLCVSNNIQPEDAINLWDDEELTPIKKIYTLLDYLNNCRKNKNAYYFVKVVEKEILGVQTQLTELNI